MKQIITILATIAAVAIVTVGIVAGVSAWSQGNNTPDVNNVNTYAKEQAITEVNQRAMEIAEPAPQLTDSTERQNLIKRLTTFNDPNKVSYIYLISYGKVMAFYTIKGKVSSVDSMLTDPTQLVFGDGSACTASESQDNPCHDVASPDLDGSYGTNGSAVFFFTTAGTYVEWNGEYMLADQPLSLTTQPELVQQVSSK